MDKPMTSADAVREILKAGDRKRQEHLALYGEGHICNLCESSKDALDALGWPHD